MSDQKPTLDQVILVDEQDQEIGVMDKLEAHRGEGKLHRASSVFLFRKNANGEWELLMQQRSAFKIVGAHQWANTVCGNVRPGESYEACAYRRLREEISVSGVSVEPLAKLQYQVHCNDEFSEHEMVTIFAGEYEGEIEMNPREVENNRWVNWQEVLRGRGSSVLEELELAPWFVHFIQQEQVVTAIQKYLERN